VPEGLPLGGEAPFTCRFAQEFSHCSNPEVLYRAIAAQTKNLRLGYGVRLLPKPYNHPVRSAESAAVLDLVSNGRVELDRD
jgi:alkanesulfonate monooxygenase SsuD/methylene tetrahydromethanopterin reductase-like flavin-dependent oxidoreductase (luciferase family)